MNFSNYDKYILSNSTKYISNSGHDENGKYTGGKAGDQKGDEWKLIPWYNRPWTVVLRYNKDARVGYLSACLGCAAALNDNIGYDQCQRNTYWTQLQKVNYDPSAISTPCEDDCTAGVSANVRAIGYVLGIEKLQKLSTGIYSRTMKDEFVKAGFTALTANKYLTSSRYLLPGDVLLYEGHHAAMAVSVGATVKSSYSIPNVSDISIPIGNKKVEEKPVEVVVVETPVENVNYMYSSAKMNVRSAQDTSANNVIGTIYAGDKVEVLEKYDNGWLKIRYKNGKAYVSNRTKAFSDAPAQTPQTKVKVLSEKLYVRRGAGTTYEIVTTIHKNEVYPFYEEKNGFARIAENRWSSLKFLQKIQ